MSVTIQSKRAAIRDLHREGCFVLPNPWDVGTAKQLAGFGFKALASTSSGAAASLGLRDGALSLEQALDHLTLLAAATDLPLNADFENGFADEPERVADNVVRAIATGCAGISVEDRTGEELYPASLAVERVRAARRAIDASGEDVLLVARTEGFLVGRTDLAPTLDRMAAMADAGADCLYAPGLLTLSDVGELVRVAAPTPVNVLLWGREMTVERLASVGVRRVSTGGALNRIAQAAVARAAEVLLAGGGLGAEAG